VLYHEEIILDCPPFDEHALIWIDELRQGSSETQCHCFRHDLGDTMDQADRPEITHVHGPSFLGNGVMNVPFKRAKPLASTESKHDTTCMIASFTFDHQVW
jgi:hypothetical protein